MTEVSCPLGHRSATTDYCDRCGTPIAVAVDAEVSSVTEVRAAAASADLCPQCATPRPPGARYCEVDGYDFERHHGASALVWCAVVDADRARFEQLEPAGLDFPAAPITGTHVLDAPPVSAGRS